MSSGSLPTRLLGLSFPQLRLFSKVGEENFCWRGQVRDQAALLLRWREREDKWFIIQKKKKLKKKKRICGFDALGSESEKMRSRSVRVLCSSVLSGLNGPYC